MSSAAGRGLPVDTLFATTEDDMTTVLEKTETTQAYRIEIDAAPEAVWEALTTPEWSERYGYGGRVHYDLHPGGAYRAHASEAMLAYGGPEVMVEGEVLEADPPRRLVQTWHALFGPETTAEAPSRLTFELEPAGGGTTVTVTHELDGAPLTASYVGGDLPEMGGGWRFVLSDLKSVLETGRSTAA
jgi:uncharacterized protein YndB with AHSA1/START domain